MLGSSILLGATLGFIDEAGVTFWTSESSGDEEESKPLSYIDYMIVFNLGCFFAALCLIIQQNLSSWRQFGILKQNEYYDLRSGNFKTISFIKTLVFSTIFYALSIFIIFTEVFVRKASENDGDESNNSERNAMVNWTLLFSSVPAIVLIFRHLIFDQRVSWIQILGGAFSILCIILSVF